MHHFPTSQKAIQELNGQFYKKIVFKSFVKLYADYRCIEYGF